MAITAKISDNFVKSVGYFRNNCIMVEVNGELRYTRIGDLAQIQSDGKLQYLEYESQDSNHMRETFKNLIEKFNSGEIELVCRVAVDPTVTKIVTAVPTPIVYHGAYHRIVPSYLVRDEAGVLFEEDKKDEEKDAEADAGEGEKPAEEADKSEKAKYILKQRAYKVVKNDNFEMNEEFKYIAVRVKGEDKIRFVELSQIKFINKDGNIQQVGENFNEFIRNLSSYEKETESVYSIILEDGRQILSLEEVYTDATYKLEDATISKFEDGKIIDVDAVGGIDLDSYKVRTLSFKKGISPTGEDDEILVTERPIDKFYVEQKTDAKDLKPKEKAYVNYECYQLDETGSGDYLKIRYKGDLADTMVALEYLFVSKTDTESLKNKLKDDKVKMVDLIGKPLYVKPKDESLGLIETEPLTNEQAIFRYNERKFLYETTKDEDIASEGKGETVKEGEMSTGAYLLLKNGQFVKEADVVQPKCYDFCQSQATTVFDAYLVTIDETTDHPKTFVIDKTYKGFNTSTDTVTITIPNAGRISVNKNTLKKVKRSTKGIKGCDIVQTTSKQGNEVESCAVLRKPKELNLGFDLPLLDEAKLDEIIKQLYEQFMKDYKAKQYDIGGQVLIPQKQEDGSLKNEFIDFVQNRRYMYSSVIPMLDGATNQFAQYLNMKANEFTFNADGSISGGPKYNAKKGVLEGYSKLGTAAVYALGFTFSGGGLLVSLASPFLLLAAPAVIGAAGIVIPIVQGIKKSHAEQRDYVFPNKSQKQNESIKQEAFEKIDELVKQVKDKYKEKKASVTDKRNFCLDSDDEQKFLSALGVIEQELMYGLAANKNGGTFRKDKGKGIINRGNAYEFGQYRKIVNGLSDEIKDLESREQYLKSEIERLKTSKEKDKDKQIDEAEKGLNEVQIAKQSKQAELDKANENLIISGTNNDTDPELAEILNRIENAKLFIRAKYFRKMDGEWDLGFNAGRGIVDLVKLLDRPDIKDDEKKKIREALISFVMHSDITVDVKGRKFDYQYSHEKYDEKDKVNWKELREIAAKYGLFADETLGIETVDIDAKSKYLQVEKPIPTKVVEREEEKIHEDVDEKIYGDEGDDELKDDADAEKKNTPTLKGLSRLMKNFDIEKFKQYFKLIEIEEVTVEIEKIKKGKKIKKEEEKTKEEEKIKRKGLVYNEDAKRTILKYAKQYEKYKELLHETIAELESKASLTKKQTEKLEKLRDFRDNSEYLIKSFNTAYGSFSEAEEEKSL